VYWGVDIGSTYTKIAGLSAAGELVESAVIPTLIDQDQIVREHLRDKPVKMLVSTGYGRHLISESTRCPVISEIRAHALGAYHAFNDVRAIIDLGGQDSKVIGMGENGHFVDFRMNDKCAAGTGKFLEMAAAKLGQSLEEFGDFCMEAPRHVSISAMCAVFAESELIGLIAKRERPEAIGFGVHASIASRLAGMARRFAVEDRVVFTGGGALNPLLKRLLEEELRIDISVPKHPQLMGAIGAAYAGLEVS
jgi:predicted CoA-substrate-specific enzyme activase